MEARNSRTFRLPPPPPAQKGATKTVQVDDLLASASNETPKKRKLFRRLCRCKMLSSKKKRKQFPRRVAIVSLTLIILCGLALAISWAAMDQVCDTPACIVAAARAVSYMDQTVNPCDDFYEFACRGLKENSSSLREDTFNPLSSTLNADYDRILTGQVRLNNIEPKILPVYDEIKRIHQGCMDGTLSNTYAPFESIFPQTDIKRAIEIGHKFVGIFWSPKFLSSGVLVPESPDDVLERPWGSIWSNYLILNISYCKETASFNAQQLNIVLPHLANWTSVIIDNRPSKVDSTINITCFPYFKALDDYVATNPQGLFQNISQIVNSDMIKYAEKIQNYTQGNEQSRLGKCQGLLRETFGDVLLHLWLGHRYKSSQAETAQAITTNIQTTFDKRISENEWLDEASKDVLRRKLRAMKFYVGEGPGFISLDTLLQNHLISKDMPDIYKIRHLSLSKGGRQSRESISTVNAFNFRDINVVEIAFSLLREPLFTLETPISMQYGSIGFIAGHEIAHGFDNIGILKDQNGTSASNSILLSDSYKTFLERANCFIDKYSGYREANMTVDGTLTLPENIADNGGLHSAWQAYQAEKTSRGPFQKRVRLPSLSYNDEQLFFISFAQTICSAESNRSIQWQILNDPHTPDKSRVNAGLSLFEPFAKTFNCPASSNMNPSKRCRMWKRGVPVS